MTMLLTELTEDQFDEQFPLVPNHLAPRRLEPFQLRRVPLRSPRPENRLRSCPGLDKHRDSDRWG